MRNSTSFFFKLREHCVSAILLILKKPCKLNIPRCPYDAEFLIIRTVLRNYQLKWIHFEGSLLIFSKISVCFRKIRHRRNTLWDDLFPAKLELNKYYTFCYRNL